MNKVKFSLEKREKHNQSKKNCLIDFFQNSPLLGAVSLDRDQETYQGRIAFAYAILSNSGRYVRIKETI